MRRWPIPTAICAALLLAGPQPARTASTPYLQLTGTIPIAGQATVAAGDAATAYGSGFCGATACSPVTLRIGDRVVTRDVRPQTDGRFRASFTVREEPGRYTVRASQTDAGGSRLVAEAPLVVAIGDTESEQPVPDVSLRVLNARGGAFLATVRRARTYARRPALLQRRSGKRWVTVKRFQLNRIGRRRFTARLPHGVSRVRVRVGRGRHGAPSIVSRTIVVRR